MYTQYEKDFILKFLVKNYPVIRYKNGVHFKRAINTGFHVYFLSEEDSYDKLRYELASLLNIIFGYEEPFLMPIVDKYLPSKRKK